MEGLTTVDLIRDPGPLTLLGLRAQSRDVLRRELDGAGLEGMWAVSDLSLGAWRGHQVALELSAQLGVELPPCEQAVPAENVGERKFEISYADVIGAFIDAEARGDRATIESLKFANRIRREVSDDWPTIFLVMAPRYAMPWEMENVLFIRFFAQALKGTRSGLVLIATDESDPQVPADWKVTWRGCAQAPAAVAGEDIAGFVPGVITPDLEDMLRGANLPHRADLVPLAQGCFLVPPEHRRHPRDVPRLEFDRLGMLARSHGWLDAYAQFHGNKMYVEPWFLYAEARQRFAEGGTGITLRLMERAIGHVRMGLDWGILQSYAQGLRVALHRFADASNIPEPPATLPAEMRSFLLQSKGWGLVMLDELPRAEECFRQARALTDPNGLDRREYLYLLNISALCQLKSNEIETALAMEEEIEERSGRLARLDQRLRYVNSINLARLHRRRGDLPMAEHYFRDAFATTLGVRSEGDAIYGNVVLARLYANSGKHREAFTCWMRAGLHWAASDAPEAMPPRVVSFILGEKSRSGANMPEAIAASLSGSILSAAAASCVADVARGGLRLEHERRLAPVFVSTERVGRTMAAAAAIDRALLTSGFSILAMREVMAPNIVGENAARLRGQLHAVLETLAPPGFLAGMGTIVVDDSLGREIPATLEELWPVCVRLNVPHVAMEGDVIALDAPMRSRIEQDLEVHVGCAVESVSFQGEHAVVCFKRYLPPTTLTLAETRLLVFLEDAATVREIVRRCEGVHSGEEVLQVLRELEQKRVVNMDLPV